MLPELILDSCFLYKSNAIFPFVLERTEGFLNIWPLINRLASVTLAVFVGTLFESNFIVIYNDNFITRYIRLFSSSLFLFFVSKSLVLFLN